MHKTNTNKGLAPDEEFDFFEIDENNLVREWVNQPKLFFHYASLLADAHQSESKAKAAREVVRAEVDLKVRKNLKKYKIDKVKLTEAVIQGVVAKQPEFKKAQKRRLRRMHDTNVLQAAVNALNHRKAALEKLVSLHGQNYFAVPQAKDDSQKTVDEMKKKSARKKVRKNKNHG